MKMLLRFLALAAAVALWPGAATADPRLGQSAAVAATLAGDNVLSLTKPVNGAPAEITLARSYGGAVVSFTYRGQQYVKNHADTGEISYGRSLQSAANFDQAGECFNPTEAGGRYDKGKERSTSEMLSWSKTENSISSKADMAFYSAPDTTHKRGCGPSRETKATINTTYRAGYLLSKTITFGVGGVPNVLDYQATYHVPESRTHGRFVPASMHLPQEFKRGYTWTASGGLKPFTQKNFRSKDELIVIATGDERHAMSIISPSPRGQHWYGVRFWPQTVALRPVYQLGRDTPKGDYAFREYIVFGTLKEVVAALEALSASTPKR